MASGPTTGAAERSPRTWQAWPGIAMAIKSIVFVVPLVASFLVVRAMSETLFRPNGPFGLPIWIVQAALLGFTVSLAVERVTRRLLPLAALFNMSLVFPDEAPSRFSVALRSGTVPKLKARVGEVRPISPSIDPNDAAARALELVAALARHDRLTRGHTERVRAYADMIGQELELVQKDRIRLSWGALLHDVGKLTVPEAILNKNGRPTAAEWELLANHPDAGREMLGPLADWLGEWVLAASQHHERWDGNGYPHGLEGSDISLAGRIVAVADAYDVITSKRSYKEPMSAEAARRELVMCSGSQFDPAIVRAFLNVSFGRRWLIGPLAWLGELPLSSIGTTVARIPVAAAAATMAVAATAVGLPPPADEVVLAFDDAIPAEFGQTPVSTVRSDTVAPATVSRLASTSITPVLTEPPPSSITVDSAVTTTTTTSSVPNTITSSVVTSRVPTTAATTTTPASSSGPTATTPASSTGPPTTSPPATGSLTITTAAPAADRYFLKNPGIGNTGGGDVKRLETSGPDNPTLPNYDTTYDTVPGLRLLPSTSGLTEANPVMRQNFVLNSRAGTLGGPARAAVWAAFDGVGPTTARLRAALLDCSASTTGCETLADRTTTVVSTLSEGFQPVIFVFDELIHSFGPSRRLVLTLIAEGATIHIGYDADDAPSSIALTLG